MSLKEQIEQWKAGAEHASQGRYLEAIDCFTEMPEPGARICFNTATMYLRVGDLENAERYLNLCVQKDTHLALGFFQRGCLHLLKRRYRDALDDFDLAEKNLRGNLLIDYKQLGLLYKFYVCEVMYNRAYAYREMGENRRAKEELDKAKEIAAKTSENRHRIVSAALDNLRAGRDFQPYRIPKNSSVFWPPKTKSESLQPVNFMGKAKVVSAIKDQDDYTGFVGVQEMRKNSPSPQPRRSPKEPVSRSKSHEPPSSRVPKPSFPPPLPSNKANLLSPTGSSNGHHLSTSLSSSSSSLTTSSSSQPPSLRPPKPIFSPPSHPPSDPPPQKPPVSPHAFRSPARRMLSSPINNNSSRSPSPSPDDSRTMTVKVHYNSTRALKVDKTVTLEELVALVCRKFDKPNGSLTLWHKKPSGEYSHVSSDVILRKLCSFLEDGFRLTLTANDAEQKNTSSKPASLKTVLAIADYHGRYSDELSFRSGDRLNVTVEINKDWYEGTLDGGTGIFPTSYVRDL